MPTEFEAYIQFANQKGAARQKALGLGSPELNYKTQDSVIRRSTAKQKALVGQNTISYTTNHYARVEMQIKSTAEIEVEMICETL